MEEKTESFSYTYSAREQEEIRSIRKKYAAPEESKMEQIRRLDRRCGQKAQARAIGLGVVGALIMGSGMSIAMTELTGLSTAAALIVGIPVGIIGMGLLALAYPVYMRTLKKEREKAAPEILRIADELLK